MTKALNFKTLAQHTSVQDKVRLIFADLRSQEESTQVRLLAAAEEEALIADARKKNQLKELNGFIRLYNLNILAVADVRTAALYLELLMGKLDLYVALAVQEQRTQDAIEKVRCSLSEQAMGDAAPFIALMQDMESRASTKAEILTPLQEEAEKYAVSTTVLQRVSDILQASKRLAKNIYLVEYLEIKGGMDFLGDDDRETIQNAQQLLEQIEKQDGALAVMRIYQMYADYDALQADIPDGQSFFEYMRYPSSFVTLTEEEKTATEKRAERIIQRAA